MAGNAAVAARKAALRRSLRALRAVAHAADPDAGRKLAGCFPVAMAQAAGDVFASYCPVGTEIDPRPLETVLLAAGGRLALPRIVVDATRPRLCFHAWQRGDPLIRGAFGIDEPAASAPVIRPSLVLTPLLGFDRAGRRLGYGRGYYDSCVQELREAGAPVFLLGLAFADQELPEIPAESHDLRLNGVLAPTGFISCQQ